MNKQSITFSASEQTLEKLTGDDQFASNTVSYVEATFTLGTNWAGFDSVRAVWKSQHYELSMVLDQYGKCDVPAEVMYYKSKVFVNLVGVSTSGDEITDRLTTYPILAFTIDSDSAVEGTETTDITPSQFDQFVSQVSDDAAAAAASAADAEAAAASLTVDSALSTSSTNPVQNKVITGAVNDLKEDIHVFTDNEKIVMTYGAYYDLSGASITIGSPTSYSNKEYALVPCSAGDVFTVSARGGTSAKPWGFVDSTGTILQAEYVPYGTVTTTDLILIAPTNSAYLVINNDSTYEAASYYGVINSKKVGDCDSKSNAVMPLVKLKGITLEKGGLNASTGVPENGDTRRLHSPLSSCHNGDILLIPATYKCYVCYYSPTNGFLYASGWNQEQLTLQEDGLFSIVISKQNSAEFTQNECVALNGQIGLYSTSVMKVNGIAFGAGHIDTTDQTSYWGLKGNDYYFAESFSNVKTLSTTRWRTENKVNFVKGAKISIASGYRFYIFKYVNDSVITTQWYEGEYTFSEDTTARLVLDTTTSPKTTYTDWGNLNAVISIINDPAIINLAPTTTESLNRDMDTALVSVGNYNTLASGDWTNPVSKKKNLTFSLITDIHGSSDALNRFIEYANNKKNYLDFCMGLGDFVVRQPSENTTWIDSALDKSEVPFFYTVGNHDVADTGVSGINESSARTKYFAKIISKEWLKGTDFIGDNKCSWYKDFSTYKIRFISLYEYGNSDATASDAPAAYCRRWMDSTLLQWFADTLYSTPTGYSVVVLLHQMPYAPMTFVDNPFTVTENIAYAPSHWSSLFLNTIDGNPIEEIVNAFKNSTSISKTYNSIASYNLGKSATVSKDFSGRSENGKFVAYFTGHTHASYIFKSQTYPDQISVIVPTGSENIFQRNYGDMLFDQSNRNKDNFYCVGIDTDLGKINIIQIGGHVTTNMRERILTSIDY